MDIVYSMVRERALLRGPPYYSTEIMDTIHLHLSSLTYCGARRHLTTSRCPLHKRASKGYPRWGHKRGPSYSMGSSFSAGCILFLYPLHVRGGYYVVLVLEMSYLAHTRVYVYIMDAANYYGIILSIVRVLEGVCIYYRVWLSCSCIPR